MTILFFALLLFVAMLGCWVVTLLGMPGNWLMIAVTAVYAYFTPQDSRAGIGWQVLVLLIVLAVLGEIIEFLAGAVGVTRAGGSRRAAVLSLAGSIAGGILGILIGLPIPLVGSVVAAVLCAGLGAMAGAIAGELWLGQDPDATWQIGKAAFWGRLFGTLGKLLVGGVMVAVVLAALVLR